MDNTIILPENISVPSKYCILMFNIINVVTKRGAINSDEFVVVGELVEFLKKELKVQEITNPVSPLQEQTKQLFSVKEE